MENIRVPIPDDTGTIVQMRFKQFLESFRIEQETAELTQQL